jgi:hypothetical protein
MHLEAHELMCRVNKGFAAWHAGARGDLEPQPDGELGGV